MQCITFLISGLFIGYKAIVWNWGYQQWNSQNSICNESNPCEWRWNFNLYKNKNQQDKCIICFKVEEYTVAGYFLFLVLHLTIHTSPKKNHIHTHKLEICSVEITHTCELKMISAAPFLIFWNCRSVPSPQSVILG